MLDKSSQSSSTNDKCSIHPPFDIPLKSTTATSINENYAIEIEWPIDCYRIPKSLLTDDWSSMIIDRKNDWDQIVCQSQQLFKLLVFVLLDGWTRLTHGLIAGY